MAKQLNVGSVLHDGLDKPSDMCVGDIMLVTKDKRPSGTNIVGHYLLCTYSGIVSLNRPVQTWSMPRDIDGFVSGRILTKGESITITVKE